jgi:hypothetical protein
MADSSTFKDFQKDFLKRYRNSFDYCRKQLAFLPKEQQKEAETTILTYFSDCEETKEFPTPKSVLGIIKKARS